MRLLPLAALLMLAACATQPAPRATVTAPGAPAVVGMERLMGQSPEAAVALLGQAKLDRREGPARQLQYAGSCILDLWFYPKEGSTPVATHAEARLPDGRDLAAGDCLRQLMTRDSAKTPRASAG